MATFPFAARAQMFSVGEDDPNLNLPRSEIYFAYEPMTVTYKGDESIFRSGIFAFEGPVLRIGYKSAALDVSLAAGGKITGIETVSYFDVGGHIDVPINLFKTRKFAINVPIQIASRYTTITQSRMFERFKFGSLTAGAGLKVLARPVDDFRLEAGIIPAYGFSFATGGLFGGSLGSISAGGRLYFDHLFEDIGLSLGYRYKIRNYDVDEEFYDYLMKAHSFQVGITF
ncbi:MAG TPA: hypothetical protein VFG39_00895 [Balneolaceae bacterium]|nr:hypothetical protein [Balneolaceae bacterium]